MSVIALLGDAVGIATLFYKVMLIMRGKHVAITILVGMYSIGFRRLIREYCVYLPYMLHLIICMLGA